jgi:deoxyribonuclease-4
MIDTRDMEKWLVDYPTDLQSLPYPEKYIKSKEYSKLGFLVEDLLYDPTSKSSRGITDDLYQNIIQLNKEIYAYGNMIRETELSYGRVTAHPDFVSLDRKHVFEVKYTGKPNYEMPRFLLQLCCYAVLQGCETFHLVLPNQGMILDYNTSEWDNKSFFEYAFKSKIEQTFAYDIHLPVGATIHKEKNSISNTVLKAVSNFKYDQVIQFFLDGRVSTKVTATEQDILQTAEITRAYPHRFFIHSAYTINLCREKDQCSPKQNPKVKKDITGQVLRDTLKKTLETASRCGFHGVVVHTGKLCDKGCSMRAFKSAVRKITESSATDKCPLLIETPAGQGTETLLSPDELVDFIRDIRSKVKNPNSLGICIDTCHIFAVGYEPLEYIDRIIQLEALDMVKLIHYNGSLHPKGSKKDRHGPLIGSYISDQQIKEFGTICHKNGIPLVRE